MIILYRSILQWPPVATHDALPLPLFGTALARIVT